MSAVPYGSLAFELWAAGKRRQAQNQAYRRVTVRAVIKHRNKILAIQPSNSSEWTLPGGDLKLGETPQEALARIVTEISGMSAHIGETPHLFGQSNTLELWLPVLNAEQFDQSKILTHIRRSDLIDEVKFVGSDEPFLSDRLKSVLAL